MSRSPAREAVLAICALAVVVAPAIGVTDPAGAPGSLSVRLRSAGRATVTFERRAEDPFAGRIVSESGVLVLESELADVRFSRTGERLTIRPDGGEWLQPQLRQMVSMGADGVAAARHWWEALFGDAPAERIVRLAPHRYLVLGPQGPGVRDSARVQLDGGGLPVRLEVVDGTGRSEYRFVRWRFEKARGRAAFVQRAPRGMEVVPFP